MPQYVKEGLEKGTTDCTYHEENPEGKLACLPNRTQAHKHFWKHIIY
jgi:hypothetical protein